MNISGSYTIDSYDETGKHLSTYKGTNAVFTEMFQQLIVSGVSGEYENDSSSFRAVDNSISPSGYDVLFNDTQKYPRLLYFPGRHFKLALLLENFDQEITEERKWNKTQDYNQNNFFLHSSNANTAKLWRQNAFLQRENTGIEYTSVFDSEYTNDEFYRWKYITTIKSKFVNPSNDAINVKAISISDYNYNEIFSYSKYSASVGPRESKDVTYQVEYFLYVPKKIQKTVDIPYFGTRTITYEPLILSNEYASTLGIPVDSMRIFGYRNSNSKDELRIIHGVRLELTDEEKSSYHPKMIVPDWSLPKTITNHVSGPISVIDNTIDEYKDITFTPSDLFVFNNPNSILDVPVYHILINGFSKTKASTWNWLISFDEPLVLSDTEFFKKYREAGYISQVKTEFVINHTVRSLFVDSIRLTIPTDNSDIAQFVQFLVDNEYWCNAPIIDRLGNSLTELSSGLNTVKISIPLPQISVLFSIDENTVTKQSIDDIVDSYQQYIFGRYRRV